MSNLRHWAIGTLLLAMVASSGFAQKARTGSARAGGAGAAVSPLKDLPGVEVRVSAGEEQVHRVAGGFGTHRLGASTAGGDGSSFRALPR